MDIAWFLSDVHLYGQKDPKSPLLESFLESLGRTRPGTHLFLLGDIFDLWIGSSSYFANQYSAVVSALIELPKRGIQVYYIEGNHDLHTDRFWSNFGITVLREDFRIQLNGLWFYLTHGDFINAQELSYHRYIQWIRSDSGKAFSRLLSPQAWWKLGSFLSHRSRQKSSQSRFSSPEFLVEEFKKFAQKRYEEKPYDVLVAGHIHHRMEDLLIYGDQKVRLINLGSWIESPKALCLHSEGQIYWDDLLKSK
jgi:UDP-2,3-diacylglucosamine hydrolase